MGLIPPIPGDYFGSSPDPDPWDDFNALYDQYPGMAAYLDAVRVELERLHAITDDLPAADYPDLPPVAPYVAGALIADLERDLQAAVPEAPPAPASQTDTRIRRNHARGLLARALRAVQRLYRGT